MNILYLMKHVSYNLHTIVRRFSNSTQTRTDPVWTPIFTFCSRNRFEDEYMSPEQLQNYLCKTFNEPPTIPVILSCDSQISYAYIPTSQDVFLIGPVRFETPVSLNYSLPSQKSNADWIETVPPCTFSAFTSNILLLYNLFQDSILENHELISFNCIDSSLAEKTQADLSTLIFNNKEANRPHNPYDQEVREFSSIENGDVEMLRKSLSEEYIGNVGTLARDKLRHRRNLAIVVITLACRAAMRGGLLPEIAYSMSDVQIQKIEEQSDPVIMLNLTHQFEFQYAQMVADLKAQKRGRYKKEQNLRVNQCKDYIFHHLLDKILIQDIADELHVHANYLSQIFKEHEGITIFEFIIHEKIDLAKNLLVYSAYTYIEIASYLGFSSQSHLGKQFKKLTNMTLRQYREQYGVKDFLKS